MVLKSSLVFEPDTSIEVFFDNIIEVGTTSTREILTYPSSDAPEIEEFARNRHPSNTAYQGSIQTDIIDKKRKLIYLNAYADKVIVIDGGNLNAIYGNINPLDISDRNLSVADLRFTAIAKGGITGQFYDSDDCTSSGTRTADSDAVNGYVEVLDTFNEEVSFNVPYSVVERPIGEYKMYVRAKDSNQVASDCTIAVYNLPDASTLSSSTVTLAGVFKYYIVDFTITATDTDDTIKFLVKKATSTSNSISIDFLGFVKV